MRKSILLLIIFIAFEIVSNAQTSPSNIKNFLEQKYPNWKAECSEIFSQIISKVETNYLGYQIEIKGKRQIEYDRFVERLRKKAQTVVFRDCIFVLQEFLRFFRDGHLFISENPILSDEEVKELTEKAEKLPLNEENIKQYLDKNAQHLDPIEGIWYESDGYRAGIIRDLQSSRRDFIAIMLSDNVKNWFVGQVKAEFRKLGDGSYNVTFYNGRHFPLNLSIYQRGQIGSAKISRGVILQMPPITWGKEYPSITDQANQIDSVNPRSPIVYFPDKSSVVFSIPSHSPEYAETLKKLVEKHKSQILQSKNLIIDIRGNEGGSSWMTNPLLQFLETKEKRQEKYVSESSNVVLSSEDNIKYFEQMQSDGWIPKNLVARMKSNLGKVIPFSDLDSNQTNSLDETKIETNLPKNVAILMDKAVISAGEAFVLEAMGNKKVTLFGENTGGVIDYQNVSVIRVSGSASLEFFLGYPMIATSNQLPKDGINMRGIEPNVYIKQGIKKPVEFILQYYKKNNKCRVS